MALTEAQIRDIAAHKSGAYYAGRMNLSWGGGSAWTGFDDFGFIATIAQLQRLWGFRENGVIAAEERVRLHCLVSRGRHLRIGRLMHEALNFSRVRSILPSFCAERGREVLEPVERAEGVAPPEAPASAAALDPILGTVSVPRSREAEGKGLHVIAPKLTIKGRRGIDVVDVVDSGLTAKVGTSRGTAADTAPLISTSGRLPLLIGGSVGLILLFWLLLGGPEKPPKAKK